MDRGRENILITGSTGFFGSRLLKEVLARTESHIFLLIRPGKNHSPETRLKKRLKRVFNGAIPRGIIKRITIVKGDITSKNLGIAPEKIKVLSKKIRLIYHCAALLGLNAPLRFGRIVNVEGTKNLLDFAYFCHKNGSLDRVGHISTVYVIGTKGMDNIMFRENQLNISQRFNNNYEQTKYEAEVIVESFRQKGLCVDIYRPSMMTETLPVKDIEAFALFFRPFKFFISGMFKEIPAAADTKQNFISVDDAAKAVFIISQSAGAKGKNYHIVNPAGVRFGSVLDTAEKFFARKRPACVPLDEFDMSGLTVAQRAMLKPFIPYLNFKAKFNADNACEILKKKRFNYHRLKDDEIESVFKFAAKKGKGEV